MYPADGRHLSWMAFLFVILPTLSLPGVLVFQEDFSTDPASVPRWISRTETPQVDPAIQSGSVAGVVTETELVSAGISALVDEGGGDLQGLLPRAPGEAFLAYLDSNGPVGADPMVVEWVLDVSGLFQLEWSIQLAAMGDYELSDSLTLTGRFDGGSPFDVFSSVVDEAGTHEYQVSSGAKVLLADPLMVGGIVVDNTWKTFQGNLSGSGETLLLRMELSGFTATTEPLGIDQFTLSGNVTPVVPEPGLTGSLLSLGALALAYRRRRRGSS